MAASEGRKSNFDKIMEQVVINDPLATRLDVEVALQEVRSNHGSFQGMKKSTIISLVLEEVSRHRSKRKEVCHSRSSPVNSIDENSNIIETSKNNEIQYNHESYNHVTQSSSDQNDFEQKVEIDDSFRVTMNPWSRTPTNDQPALLEVATSTDSSPPVSCIGKPYNIVRSVQSEEAAQYSMVDCGNQPSYQNGVSTLSNDPCRSFEFADQTRDRGAYQRRVLVTDVIKMLVKRNADLSVGKWEVISVLRELYSINDRTFDVPDLDSWVLIEAAEKLLRFNRGFLEKVNDISVLNSTNSIISPSTNVSNKSTSSAITSRSHSVSSGSDMPFSSECNIVDSCLSNNERRNSIDEVAFSPDCVTNNGLPDAASGDHCGGEVTYRSCERLHEVALNEQVSTMAPKITPAGDSSNLTSTSNGDSWNSNGDFSKPNGDYSESNGDYSESGPPPGFCEKPTSQPVFTVIDKFNLISSKASERNANHLPVLKNRRQPESSTKDRCKLCADNLVSGQGPKQKLSCGHSYHSSCLRMKPTSCPNCRQLNSPTKDQPISSDSVSELTKLTAVKNAWKQISVPSSFAGDSETHCAICFEALNFGNPLTLVCKHRFHAYCMKNWFMKGKERSCPICRKFAILPQEFPSLGDSDS